MGTMTSRSAGTTEASAVPRTPACASRPPYLYAWISASTGNRYANGAITRSYRGGLSRQAPQIPPVASGKAHTVQRLLVSRGSSASHGAHICAASASAPHSRQEWGSSDHTVNGDAPRILRAPIFTPGCLLSEHSFRKSCPQFDNTLTIRNYTSR